MALRNKNLEMTDSGSGSTTKADDQKKTKTLSVQQTSVNTTTPAQATASTAAQTTTEPEKVRYNSANYRHEATDTGGGYEKNQIVWRDPDLPIRTVIDVYRDTTPGVLLTQEEKNQRMEAHTQREAEQYAKIAASEEYLKQLELARLGASGRFYGQNLMYGGEYNLAEILEMKRAEEEKLQQLKEELYYVDMQQDQAFAEDLYLRGGGALWDTIQQEQTVYDQIARNRQALAALPAGDPRRQALEQEIQQDLAWVNYVKQVASENGIDYNDLVEYAQRVEDEAKMQENAQFWTDYTQKDDRSMNAANWASVPMKVIGSATSGISNAMQSARNALSGQYRPVNRNTIWHYGTNVSNAIRETTKDVILERLGDGVGGYVGEFVYDVSMGLLDSALEWGVGQIIVGSNLIPDNMKDFLEKVEQASGFVENNAELMQTYREELEDGKSPAEAFGECVKILVAEGIWSGIEKKLEGDWNLDGLDDPTDSIADRNQERTNSADLHNNVLKNIPQDLTLNPYTMEENIELARLQNALIHISSTQPVQHPSYEKIDIQNIDRTRNRNVYKVNNQAILNELHRKQNMSYRR